MLLLRLIQGQTASIWFTTVKHSTDIICVISWSRGTWVNQQVDFKWGWNTFAVIVLALMFQWTLHKRLWRKNADSKKHEWLQSSAETVGEQNLFLCWDWKLMTHQGEMLSGLRRVRQWVIGSCGGADIGIKPKIRGKERVWECFHVLKTCNQGTVTSSGNGCFLLKSWESLVSFHFQFECF